MADEKDERELDTPVQHETSGTSAEEYIDGTQLLAVVGSVTLVAFLMLLDMSIIATVQCRLPFGEAKSGLSQIGLAD